MLGAFGWSLALPLNVFDLIALIFVGHRAQGSKKSLWLKNISIFSEI